MSAFQYDFRILSCSSLSHSAPTCGLPPCDSCNWHIFSSFLIHLLPYLLSLFLTSCGPHSSIPQPRLLPWICLSFSKLNYWIFLCVASPGCTGFSPLQLSRINVHIIHRQPPWFPIQLKFVLVVFKSCLRHASGSLIQFVSLCSSSCSS